MMNTYTDLGGSAWKSPAENFLSHKRCTFFPNKSAQRHCLEYFYISGPNRDKQIHRHLDHVYQNAVKYIILIIIKIENKFEIPEVLYTKIYNIYQIDYGEVQTE